MLSKLKLINFRNYRNQTFNFLDSCNVFIAPNGKGKTNILESISLLATSKSFRSVKESDYINFNLEDNYHHTDFAIIDAVMDQDRLELILNKNKSTGRIQKQYKINGAVRKKTDIGHLKVVSFAPEDLYMLTGSPTRRRDYLDFVVSQKNTKYKNNLSTYIKCLKQRNKHLESITLNNYQNNKDYVNSELEFWDSKAVELAENIQREREIYIDYINENAKKYTNIYRNCQLEIKYKKSLISKSTIEENREIEILTGITKSGPQKDDFMVFLHKQNRYLNAKTNISRGEQRVAILILKYIERDFIEKHTKIKPLLLLDDIFSELDNEYREKLTHFLRNHQSFITSADRNNLPTKLIEEANTIDLW